MRILTTVFAALLGSCTLGYQAHQQPNGLEPIELACARQIYVGEGPHTGMPHMPINAEQIAAAKRAIHRAAPEIRFVDSPSSAEFVVSVIMSSTHSCTHCQPESASEWQAIIERGGPTHQAEYPAVGPYLLLSGRVHQGGSASHGFARQLATILHAGRCGG